MSVRTERERASDAIRSPRPNRTGRRTRAGRAAGRAGAADRPERCGASGNRYDKRHAGIGFDLRMPFVCISGLLFDDPLGRIVLHIAKERSGNACRMVGKEIGRIGIEAFPDIERREPVAVAGDSVQTGDPRKIKRAGEVAVAAQDLPNLGKPVELQLAHLRVVVAQDTSRYGTDLPGHKRLLPELLRQLCQIDGLHWIRVHYVYPDEIDDELIDVIASQDKIVKYLDIPIQHCNDEILRLMNRRGDGAFLRELLAKLRRRIPGLVIRTSLITGLPGEGEKEFQELCDFLREQRLERAGAFPFSPEEGTPAAEMEFVENEVAVLRAQTVEMIQSGIMDDFNASLIGKTLEVLVDGYDPDAEQFFGRTYADSPEIDGRVWISCEEPLREGMFVMVKIDGSVDGDLTGYVLEEEDL